MGGRVVETPVSSISWTLCLDGMNCLNKNS
uniref:Ycf15 protein n=1 Tax=Swertia bimaculata TaxID=148627 RepID=A0A8F2XRH9_SWEBI|nr:Ycf15 protein [Swertia bimaculata]QWW90723.1 Ycf15 protein [Swertia bimaculata]QWW90791.1 Ycf15 protein [Swertia bimaculata]QWW90808.1 Ycf15 protein [Swertia bimaculata]QWW90876.1 Ycf15 protein [Swertia bimaculata]